MGRLASRAANGSTTSFLYSGLDIVQDRASDGSQVDYLSGPGIDDHLRQSSASTGSLYFLQDPLGSTIALTNQSGGIVERRQYEPFGGTSSNGLTRYTFTGREHDPLTGLMYYRARWYDPSDRKSVV